MSLLTKAGIKKLSELEIDVNKDWAAKEIKNLAAPAEANAAVRANAHLRAPDSTLLDGSTKAQVQDHAPQAHTLASHSTKAHAELTGVGSSDHHVRYTDGEAVAAVEAAGLALKPQAATLIVSAADSLHPERADYHCDGVNDHLEIQEALDALPATGGEVLLLDGTYNIEVSLAMDSYQTLRGCGPNTVLTTSTAITGLITAVGGSGTEKCAIVIADLRIDGASTCYAGIYWDYVDNSDIRNVWAHDCNFSKGVEEWAAIQLLNCDYDSIVGCRVFDSTLYGVQLGDSFGDVGLGGCTFVTISDNVIVGNDDQGLHLYYSNNNTITGNTVEGNGSNGIFLSVSNNNSITGNTVEGNSGHGISLFDSSNNNTVIGSTCIANSQSADNTYDNIYLLNSDYNLVSSNICRQGSLANQPKYGINVSNAACDHNMIEGNSLYDSGQTGDLNDAGTNTHKRDNLSKVGAWLADV